MCMEETDILLLYNRSSNPSKGAGACERSRGGGCRLLWNLNNDSEIMMEFYNITDKDITIHVGDTIGQAVLTNFIHSTAGYAVLNKKENRWIRQYGRGLTLLKTN